MILCEVPPVLSPVVHDPGFPACRHARIPGMRGGDGASEADECKEGRDARYDDEVLQAGERRAIAE